jgi:NAD(P)-dependent dehydrogenase (short-subunit alcohol dehydrogenase family)
MSTPTIWELFDLKDSVFFVAGGARHLGRDMAAALAEAHADGVITSRSADSAHATAAAIAPQTGQRILGLQMDASDEQSVDAAVREAQKAFGRIDILVNNVGGGGLAEGEGGSLEDRGREAWERLLRVNLTAPYLVARRVAAVMRDAGRGSIINIASVAGIVGRDRRVYPPGMIPQTLDYAAAKGGMLSLTRDLAALLGPEGIRVNAISPGGFERGQPSAFIQSYADKCALGRMGRDGVDLKGAAVYLAGAASAYVTGHNLVVDGGFSVWQ